MGSGSRGDAEMWLAVALVIVAFWFFRSPLRDAVADAIRRGAGVPVGDPQMERALAGMSEEMNSLREHVTELAERVDFAERALAEVRRREALQPPRT